MDIEMLELIEEALDSTLRELQSAQRRPSRACLQAASVGSDADVDGGLVSLSEIVASPAAVSLRAQLHRLGWLLLRHVGTKGRMHEVAEWVALLDVAAYDFRAQALRDAFAGVGVGEDLWA